MIHIMIIYQLMNQLIKKMLLAFLIIQWDWKKIKDFFLTESGFCINDLIKRGYSKKGDSIHKMYKHIKNKERYSLLAAISKEGIVRFSIYKDTIDGNKYRQFIEDNKDGQH